MNIWVFALIPMFTMASVGATPAAEAPTARDTQQFLAEMDISHARRRVSFPF